MKSKRDTPKLLSVPMYSEKRLPSPCPLPTFTPIVQQGIENQKIKGNIKTRMLRESANHFYGLCPRPTPKEYQIMSIALCDLCPQLRDKTKDSCNWVSIVIIMQVKK